MNNRKIKKRKTENPLRELFGALNFKKPAKTILKEPRRKGSKLIDEDVKRLDKKITRAATKRFLKR